MFGFIFYLVILWIVVYNIFYRKCPPDSALVIIERTNTSSRKIKKILTSGGEFINPFTYDFKILSFKPSRIGINQKNILTKLNSRIDLDITFLIQISRKMPIMRNAAIEILRTSQFEMFNKAREIITNQVRTICAIYTKEKILSETDFKDNLERTINSELNKIGMEILHIYINSLTDNTEIKSIKENKKTIKNNQSFSQEFNEIAKKEAEKIEEETALTDAIRKPFNNESFEEFKALTENFPNFELNNDFEQINEQEQIQEQTVKQELTEVIKKVVEKNTETTQENYTEPSTEPVYNEPSYSEPTTVEQTFTEPTPSDDIFASVRHYFENKNQ